jgi:hypothetical protein
VHWLVTTRQLETGNSGEDIVKGDLYLGIFFASGGVFTFRNPIFMCTTFEEGQLVCFLAAKVCQD